MYKRQCSRYNNLIIKPTLSLIPDLPGLSADHGSHTDTRVSNSASCRQQSAADILTAVDSITPDTSDSLSALQSFLDEFNRENTLCGQQAPVHAQSPDRLAEPSSPNLSSASDSDSDSTSTDSDSSDSADSEECPSSEHTLTMPPKHKAGQDRGEASPHKQSKPDPNATLPDTDDSINEQSMHDAHESPDAHFQVTGGRQDPSSQATPQTSTPGTTPGTVGTPQYAADPGQSTSAGLGPTADQVSDLTKVCEAVQNSGGAPTQKPPDLDNLTPRIGQDLKVVNSTLNYEEEDFPVPARPDEASLRRITPAELLPPPSSRPVPLDLEFDPDAPEFVSQQRIEFLILMKTEADSTIPWGFPDKDILQKLLTHVRDCLLYTSPSPRD